MPEKIDRKDTIEELVAAIDRDRTDIGSIRAYADILKGHKDLRGKLILDAIEWQKDPDDQDRVKEFMKSFRAFLKAHYPDFLVAARRKDLLPILEESGHLGSLFWLNGLPSRVHWTGLFPSKKVEFVEPALRALNALLVDPLFRWMKKGPILVVPVTRGEDLSVLKEATNFYGLNIRGPNQPDTKLMPLPSLKYLSLTEWEGLELAKLEYPGLKTLDLYHCDIENLDGVEVFPSLTELSVGCDDLSDISAIKGMPLRNLKIGGSKVESFEVIATLPRLTSLDLNHTYAWKDPTPIAKATELRELHVTLVHSLDWIKPLTQLEKVWVRVTQTSDLEPLSGLTNLRALSLSVGETRNVNFQRLKTLTNIRELSLYSKEADDFGVLRWMPEITDLSLRYCPGLRDLEPLQGLKKLEKLDLSGCASLTDLSPLAELENLVDLRLTSSGVRTTREIAKIPNLKALILSELAHTPDLSYLDQCKSLVALDLSRIEVRDLSFLASLDQLRYLFIDPHEQVKPSKMDVIAKLPNLCSVMMHGTWDQQEALKSQIPDKIVWSWAWDGVARRALSSSDV